MYYQQGDVIIESVSIPDKAVSKQTRLLAEGETTGHAHKVAAGDVQMLELGQQLFMRVLSGNARIVHEEHKEVLIPPGDYEIRHVQEYDHFAEEAANVRD